MGRAGRGGGSSGGGGSFGGSRGFGSHSGSSRSSHSSWSSGSSHRSSWSSSSHSSWGGSYHRHYNSGPRFYYFGGSRYSGGNSFNGLSNKAHSIIFAIVMVIAILSALSEYIDFSRFESGNGSGNNNSGITASTVNREKFDEAEKYYVEGVWYRDELDWIKKSSKLESGMKYFYEKTGIQPFLYISGDYYADNKELEDAANEIYDEYFDDEAHLLVLFSEHNSKYKCCYVTGVQAKTVIDSEAGEILLDYIDHYYYSDLDEDEFFARSFREAADRMMRVTPKYGWIAFIFILVIILTVIFFIWWKKKKKHKLDEMKQAQDILNSDLNEFGSSSYSSGSSFSGSETDSSVEELKKKYDN